MIPPFEILLVEDDPADVEIMTRILRGGKMAVRLNVVCDAEAALKYLHREEPHQTAKRPDLILLDLNLPGMSGHELLQIIKKDKNFTLIPVVILSTSEAFDDIIKSYEAGANCYVTKPVSFDELVRVLHQVEEFWFTVAKLPPQK